MLDLSTILLMGRDLAASANEKTELRSGLEAYRHASALRWFCEHIRVLQLCDRKRTSNFLSRQSV